MVIPTSAWKAYAALGSGVLCIGLSAIFVKLAGVSGLVSAFYRVFIAALVLTPWWLLRRPRWAPATAIRGTIVGGLFFALDLVLWNSSLNLTSAGAATLLANNAPLWVGLAAWLILHERLGRNFWAGLVVALVGMTLIVGSTALFSGSGLGNLLAISASFFYAAYLLITQRVRAQIDTLSFMVLSALTGAALLLAVALVLRVPLTGFPTQTWGALLALGLVSQVGGWLAINYALGHIPATRVSVTLLAQAVVTTLVAIPILHELPSAVQIVGGILVLSGIFWVYRQPRQARPSR